MIVDKGYRAERAARGLFVGAIALACNACGGGDSHHAASGGKANAGGNANRGGTSSSGGSKSSGGRAGSGGEVTSGGAAIEGGASNEGGALNEGGAVNEGGAGAGGGTTSAGGTSGQGGSGAVVGMAGDGGTDTGGTSSGGTNSGGTNSGGMNEAGGVTSGGTNSGGTNSGGMNSGGTSSGGMNEAGGASSGGTGSGGMNSGGTGSGGMSSGGTGSGGAPASCGNAVREGAEECDDGNTQNLDGCNSGCGYEVVDRMTSISVQGVSAPSFCSPTTNALGRAFSSAALGQINAELQQSISDGALNNLVQFSGLADLTGASDDSSLAIGFLPAAPDLANGAWPGGAPLDFWFRVPSASVDAQRVPLNSLAGSLTARDLSAGPGLLKLPIAIGGAPSTLSVSNARLRAAVAAAPAPNVPAPPPTNLAPGLTVFQSMTGSGSGQGICGNVTVESLAHIPVPPSLASGASSACLACTGSRTYTACPGNSVEPGCNSMLDVLVGGCKTLLCFVTVVTPAQPDVPAPGSASVRTLSIGSGNAVPSDQSTGNEDAYSSYFKFEANRAHITGLR